jgi:beta-glucanase (GH16 family)
MRRWVAGGAVALLLLALPAAAAASTAPPLQAHSASKTATSILHQAVPTQGSYLLIVYVRSRGKHSRLVDVYIPGQKMRSVVANPWWGAAVYYRLSLSTSKLLVRTVNAPPAVQVRAKLSLRKAATPTSPASTTPASTTSPSTTTTTTTTTPVSTPPVTTPPPAPSPYTNLVWSDNFQNDFAAAGSAPNQLPNATDWSLDDWGSCGDGTISQSNTNSPGTSNTNLDGINPDQNAYLTSNGLAITAVRTSSGSYVSAQVDSVGKVSRQYGEVEASIELPQAQGMCPAFWMLGDSNITGSSSPGEIDVVEAPTFGNSFSGDYFDLHGVNTTQIYETSTPFTPALESGFHTYAIIWTPTSITWTIDGIAYASASQASLIAGASWSNALSYGTFHLIFDLAIAGWACDFGSCAPESSPASSYTMYIQWVKWFQ